MSDDTSPAAPETIEIIIDPAITLDTGKPLKLNLNGTALDLPVNEPISVNADLAPTLRECGVPFETVAPEDQASSVPATSEGGAPGGSGAPLADIQQVEPEPDPLLSLLDQSIPDLAASLDGLTVEELDRLAGAETAGKTRVGALKAIDKAKSLILNPPA